MRGIPNREYSPYAARNKERAETSCLCLGWSGGPYGRKEINEFSKVWTAP
jgi:hypothetical protein